MNVRGCFFEFIERKYYEKTDNDSCCFLSGVGRNPTATSGSKPNFTTCRMARVERICSLPDIQNDEHVILFRLFHRADEGKWNRASNNKDIYSPTRYKSDTTHCHSNLKANFWLSKFWAEPLSAN